MSTLRAFPVVLVALASFALAQGDAPWRTKLRTLLSVEAPAGPVEKATLLRPEFAFKARRKWLYLPELAKELGTDDAQREVVLQVLDEGGKALREALAAEKADQDLGVATALFVAQMWQCAAGKELDEAQTDAVHAQVVQALAGPEVAAMADADKQRCWELCVGYTTWFAAMLEAVEDDDQKAELRKAAGAAFAGLVGTEVAQCKPGARGLAPARGGKPKAGKPAPAAAAAPGASPLPASGPAIAAVSWAAPDGWLREESNGNVVFRTTLRDVERDGRPVQNTESAHQAAIAFLPVQAATVGPTALFEQVWREQFAAFEPGDTFVHYRGRLPSQLVVLYMGRFHRKPGTPSTMGNPDTYGALWLVDLGGNRFQPIVAVVEPRDPGLGMDTFKEGAALQALSFPLWKVLESVRPKDGKPPHPAGGYFAGVDLLGDWEESSSAFGGNYYSTVTGGFAGAAVTASAGSFALRADGTYDYSFGYYAHNPQSGNSSGSTRHGGRFKLDGDVVLVEPSKPISYEFGCCAVGIGRVVTPKGDRRVLVTVGKHRDGGFRQMPLIPNGNATDSTLSFYVEKAK
ncbi:MAG: hypothetical protein JNK15_19005 [Planctomycetes bacterium]|nr:hypothetical protein [Planctomycetota bacterium]